MIKGQFNCKASHYTHNTTPHWKLLGDVSVKSNGLRNFSGNNELVSPKLKGIEGLNELMKVCKVLEEIGCKVNATCGLHVHQDVSHIVATDKNAKRFLKNLIVWVSKFEHIIYKLISPSRLKTGYSRPIRSTILESHSLSIGTEINENDFKRLANKTVKTLVKKTEYSVTAKRGNRRLQRNRYSGLNLYKVWERGSVEFRYHQGTINFDKIANWIVLTQAIINVVETKSYVSLKYVSKGLKGLSQLRTALGFCESNKDDTTKNANKFFIKRFRSFEKRNREYLVSSDYFLVADGLYKTNNNREA